MKTLFKTICLVVLCGCCAHGTVRAEHTAPPDSRPVVQLAILLDTSSSMSGLIDQARSQLWKIVNELVHSRLRGQQPEIQVALYEYGKSTLERSEGYIRQITALTEDLDLVSEKLFELGTNGGDEYCGQVIQSACDGLRWSKASGALKLIFIAGNEPFTQGSVDYREACKLAASRGITVNTIHCGDERSGVEGHWKDGALLADGEFLNIDHNRVVAHIAAPQDADIERLGRELNDTYIPFGARGKSDFARQAAQDANAYKSAKGSMTQRGVFKSSASYSNEAWDLVDATAKGKVDLAEIDKDDLPENMRKMDRAEQAAFVEKNRARRGEIQAQIRVLDAERRKFVAEQQKKKADETGEDTLDRAMIDSIHVQAESMGYSFE
ncbi:MAG: VWA domain-containing protein [Deltaproteobacteria bacterium]|nr:VWA domain-containing protein [Deltaproteobacteria bacterium]